MARYSKSGVYTTSPESTAVLTYSMISPLREISMINIAFLFLNPTIFVQNLQASLVLSTRAPFQRVSSASTQNDTPLAALKTTGEKFSVPKL
jgi:hypothetical protein